MAIQAHHERSLDRSEASDETGAQAGKRTRLTVDLEPTLRLRIKVAAAQSNLSIRDYVERILERAVPQVAPMPQKRQRPVTQATLDRLLQARDAVMHGRRFTDDSADLLREAREERMGE